MAGLAFSPETFAGDHWYVLHSFTNSLANSRCSRGAPQAEGVFWFLGVKEFLAAALAFLNTRPQHITVAYCIHIVNGVGVRDIEVGIGLVPWAETTE